MKSKVWMPLILLLFLSASSLANAGWKYITPMPHGRYGHDATLGIDGNIYVMGGYSVDIRDDGKMGGKHRDGQYSNLVYYLKKDEWQYLEPVPGKMIKKPNGFKIYDPEMGIWTSAGKVDNKDGLYKVYNPKTKKYRFRNIPSNQYLRKTDLERLGNGVSIVTGKDGKIYWIGGMEKWIYSIGENIVLPYDPIYTSWPLAYGKRIVLDEKRTKNSYSSTTKLVTIFETDVPPMLERRIDHRAVVTADGSIYVMGGYRTEIAFTNKFGHFKELGERVLDSMECYNPKVKKWEFKKPLMSKRMLFAAVVGHDDKIYIFGGSEGMPTKPSVSVLNTTEVYDPKTDTWTYRTPMPSPRKSHYAVLGADGKIYILGGSILGGPPLNDVFIYDPIKDIWKEGPEMKRPRSNLAAVATPDGKIYAIGGTDMGAYKERKKYNFFLPKAIEFYTGKVQDTVEVLDIFE